MPDIAFLSIALASLAFAGAACVRGKCAAAAGEASRPVALLRRAAAR